METHLSCEAAITLIKNNPDKYCLYKFNSFGRKLSKACKDLIRKSSERNIDVAFLQAVEKLGPQSCMSTGGSRLGVCLVKAEYLPWISANYSEEYATESPKFEKEKYLVVAMDSHFQRNESLQKMDFAAWRAKAYEPDVFKILIFRYA